MFGSLEDGPDLTIDPPEFHKSHDMHTDHYCMACGCSVHSPVAQRPCRPRVADAPVTVQPVKPREIDWLDLNRSCSA